MSLVMILPHPFHHTVVIGAGGVTLPVFSGEITSHVFSGGIVSDTFVSAYRLA